MQTSIRLVLVALFLAPFQAGMAATDEALPATCEWWQAAADELPVLRLQLPPSALERWSRGRLLRAVLRSGTDGDDEASLRVLYPVVSGVESDAIEPITLLCRLPIGLDPASVARLQLLDEGRSNRPRVDQPIERLTRLDDEQGASLLADWGTAYRAQLLQRMRLHKDHDLEFLLYWRWFGAPSTAVEEGRRRQEPLKTFLRSVSGLRDVEEAVPRSEAGRLQAQVYDQSPPEPILLPRVAAPDEQADSQLVPLARWVPRSCWYIGWPDWAHCSTSLRTVATTFDRWSGPVYGQSGIELIEELADQLGLDAAWRRQHLQQGIRGVALIGWDPYFQAGNNIALLIASDADLPIPAATPASAQPRPGVTILATKQRLVDRMLTAQERGRSLMQEPHFLASRERLLPGDGEEEVGFLYLSDFWLTNFISPRWQILRRRILQAESRIRMAYLLRAIERAEGRSAATTLSELTLLSETDRQWLLADLEERDGRIVHRRLGGIGDHPPIDELPFEQTSTAENESYEDFRRLYVGRWQQMDPIALQIVDRGTGRWTSRLSISPISRRSDFRSLQQFLLPGKRGHSIAQVPDIAVGMSVLLRTPMLSGMLGQQLPVTVQLQLLCRDFAPTSFAVESWLHAAPAQDRMSFFRLPAAVLMPSLVFQQLRQLTSSDASTETDYSDLVALFANESPGFPLFAWLGGEDGVTACGFDPGTVGHIRDHLTGMEQEDTPCDIRLWADFQKGYMLRRKLWQWAVKDRSLAGWRRASQAYRWREALGDVDGLPGLSERLGQTGAWAMEVPPAAMRTSALPLVRRPRIAEQYRSFWGQSAIDGFGDLPAVLLALQRLDLFVTVEPEALLFETRFVFDEWLSDAMASDEEDGSDAIETTTQTELDFDEDLP